MGKGDWDAPVTVDTDGSGTRFLVSIELWDDMTASEFAELRAKAAQGQAQLDSEAMSLWGWYSSMPVAWKARLRTSLLALG